MARADPAGSTFTAGATGCSSRATSIDDHPAVHRRRFLQAGVGVSLAGRPLLALARLWPAAPSVATGTEYVAVAAFPSGVLSGDPTTRHRRGRLHRLRRGCRMMGRWRRRR